MEKLGQSEEDLLSQTRLLTAEGVLYGGADALMAIAREIWWAKPLYWIAALPFVKPALRGVYGFVARHRYCFGRTYGPAQRFSEGREVRSCGRSGESQKRHKTRVFFDMP